MGKLILIFLCAIVATTFWVLRNRNQVRYIHQDAGREGREPQMTLDRFIWTTRAPAALVYSLLGFVAFIALWNTSVVNPGGNQIAIYDRIYFCKSIEGSRNVALPGECGRQAEVTMPGFHLSFLVGVLNDVTYEDMVDVPEGHYAVLTARDGLKLDDGQVAARPWLLGENKFKNAAGKEVTGDMLDAKFFLTEGMGQAGPQATILTPKRYPINPYLWSVSIDTVVTSKDGGKKLTDNFVRTTIPPGHVGVVKSALDEQIVPTFMHNAGSPVNCASYNVEEKNLGQLRAVLVQVGCRGVWKEPLPPGEYFVNERVYKVVDVDTRVQNWIYQGGYTRRYIDLNVNDDGTIHQVPHEEKVDTPQGAAGEAIAVKAEGWTLYQELRIQARTKPEDAPLVVAAVGGVKEVEDRIITPQARSVLRNIGGSNITVKNTTAYEEAKSEFNALKARLEVLKDGNADVGLTPEQRKQEAATLERQIAGFNLPNPEQSVTRPTRVLDFQNEREALEKLVANDIQRIGREAGIEIVSVTFGNADLPPELLVARKIEQLSGQWRTTYTQMRTAQVQRQSSEAAKARADKQKDLVQAQIDLDVSKVKIETRSNDGTGERRFLEEQAQGQSAQTNVLGADKVMALQALQLVLATLKDKPELLTGIKWPSTAVFGGGGFDLSAAAAVFMGGSKSEVGPRSTTTVAQQPR